MTQILVDYQGELLALRQLSEKTGIPQKIIKNRYWSGKRGAELTARSLKEKYFVEYGGEMLSIKQLSKKTGISRTTLRKRCREGKCGTDIFAPLQRKKQLVEYNGEMLSIFKLSKKTGISYATLHKRHQQGKRGTDLLSPRSQYKQYPFRGQMLTIKEIASIAGVSAQRANSVYRQYHNFDILDSANGDFSTVKVLCVINGEKYRATDLVRFLKMSRQAILNSYHKNTADDFKEWVLRKMARVNSPPPPPPPERPPLKKPADQEIITKSKPAAMTAVHRLAKRPGRLIRPAPHSR